MNGWTLDLGWRWGWRRRRLCEQANNAGIDIHSGTWLLYNPRVGEGWPWDLAATAATARRRLIVGGSLAKLGQQAVVVIVT